VSTAIATVVTLIAAKKVPTLIASETPNAISSSTARFDQRGARSRSISGHAPSAIARKRIGVVTSLGSPVGRNHKLHVPHEIAAARMSAVPNRRSFEATMGAAA